MSSREFAEWQVYARSEPLPGGSDTMILATIAAMVRNALVDPKKAAPANPEDFIPGMESGRSRTGKGQTVEEMKNYIDIYRIAYENAPERGRS